jgi:transcriptional regulator with XRE-family HTH domain
VDPSPTGADAGRVGSKDQWDAACAAFGAAVRVRRERLGLSQEAFAHKADLERSYVSGIERGVRNPTLKVIDRLAKALSTKASKLLAAAGQ